MEPVKTSETPEKKESFKCSSCGWVADEAKECCGKPMEKLCDCGSGEKAEGCCEGK